MAIVAEAAIEIEAPIELVWAILVDLAAYAGWNPFIVEVTNITPRNHPLAVDSQFTLRCEYTSGFVGGLGTTSTSRERVTQITAPSGPSGGAKAVLAYRLAGVLPSLRILQGTRLQWLEQDVAGGATRYRTEERFTGLGAALVPLAQVQDGFRRMAAALKARAEYLKQGPRRIGSYTK